MLLGVVFERAAEADLGRQKQFSVEKTYPSLAQLIFTQIRFIPAEEWGSFGGIVAQWKNVANVALVAITGNRKTAARLSVAKKPDWRKLARCRRDLTESARRL